jgi:hypothetical protein
LVVRWSVGDQVVIWWSGGHLVVRWSFGGQVVIWWSGGHLVVRWSVGGQVVISGQVRSNEVKRSCRVK